MPRLQDWEIKKFWEIFSGLGPVDNKLGGDKVSNVFKNSQLPDDSLAKIWKLSDIDQDGQLDFEEFCIAMKLIFDTVNKSMPELPDSLPQWLIPGSKAHLVDANNAVQGVKVEDDDDDGYGLRDNSFDWYISPSDKEIYENIYLSATDKFGRIKFESLQDLYEELKLAKTDISSAWNLVNPKQFETIDKDQCLVYLHILNQTSNGKKTPSSVPASLRATFSKEVPKYDLNAPVKKQPKPQFGASFLKSGVEKKDYSEAESSDWGEARLKKQLLELEDRIHKVESEMKQDDYKDKQNSMVKYEFEQLLKFKQAQLAKLQKGGSAGNSLSALQKDVEDVEQQVNVLQEYLMEKERELSSL